MSIKQNGGVFGRNPTFNDVTIDSLTATTADINGGTIDGTIIGGTSAVAGTFTAVTASTGIYLGGAGAANLLDDYEEGTWTATVSNGTVVSTNGIYTKNGRQVTIAVKLDNFSDISTGSALLVQSLPFASSAINYSTMAVMAQGIDYVIAGSQINCFLSGSSSQILFYNTSDNGAFATISNLNLTNTATSTIFLTLTYITDA
jgi:hypothetical protein